jgi:integrase
VTDTDVTRYPGVHTRPDSNIYQFGLKPPTDVRHHFPGYWAVRCSLKTADLRQANAKAIGLHAEWIARFDQFKRADNPVHADLTPALLAVIAAEIRRWILQADENMRAIPAGPNALLARERRIRAKAIQDARVGLDSLMIPARTADDEPFAATEPTDPDEGLTEAQREVVARFNTERAAEAAIDLAAMRLKTIRPWAESVTKELGITVDWSSEAGRAGLLECLKAHRNASAELLRRDAGDVIDTPTAQDGRQWTQEPARVHVKKEAVLGEGMRMADALKAWMGLGVRVSKTVGTFTNHVRRFEEMMGDPLLTTLQRPDGVRFRDSLTEWAVISHTTAVSADNILSSIKALGNVAKNKGWFTTNPFEGLKVTEGGKESEGREPWTPDDLSRLFDSPLFTRYELPAGSAIEAKAGLDAAYWVPLLALYTGARPGEICQLWTDDISELPSGLVVEIRKNTERGQRLKNPSSWRALPIHSELMRLGFGDYWRTIIAQHEAIGPLFPALRRGGKNGAAGQFGQWFGEFKKDRGFATPTKTLHSFRHTVETELAFAEVSPTLVDAITGHEAQGVGRKTYGATIRRQAERLRPHVERLRYPDLVLQRVFKVPGR